MTTERAGTSPVEQHLGDRLAALVDGELAHDARERVLAHLATCGRCKAEADAQRRLKSVFAEAAPPPPSEGLLARLQGLPGGGEDDGSGPFGSGGGVFGVGQAGFAYVPVRDHGTHGGSRNGGFPIHDVERSSAARHGVTQRGRRFAFVAAGAVSLAALALGGALPFEAALDSPGHRGDGAGATSARTAQAPGAAPVSGGDALLAAVGAGERPYPLTAAPGPEGDSSLPSTTSNASDGSTLNAPLALPGRTPAAPSGAAGGSPLIRPMGLGPQLAPLGGDVSGAVPSPAPVAYALPPGAAEH